MNEDEVFPIGDPEYDAVYAQEAATIDASELIARALEASGISRADLARRLGVSRGEITARLKGERNITVRTLAETLHALGEHLSLDSERAVDERRARAREWQRHESAHTPTAAVRAGGWIRPEVHRAR
ncbi:helix-turn-helix domain-containing protein [Rathayibacter soli]|uniref:helix-turn-helix domain-containing protein n=1 Tax=Rathayibacter soli TaxID=3144168 RepID=UPI0027E3D39A|nr:helix-turn-helix transcriptional regulator [Glaciibacter superstes]